jgi:hypothetical protein
MRAARPKRVSMPRLTFLALALVALLAAAVPSLAAKSKKASGPTVSNFSPTKPELGGKLVLFGKGYAKQKKKNTVILRAPSGGTTFIKPTKAQKGKLTLRLPNTLERLMRKKAGKTLATRFRVRVLAGKKFGPWTKKKRSPVIRPSGEGSDGSADCDNDDLPNGADSDDDNDLLPDTLEDTLKTDGCIADTDKDGVEDGFEYQSALDLNDDEDQEPNTSLPYPGKRPYPNPLDPSDVGKDFDGDSLQLAEEQKLWKYAIGQGSAVRTLTPLYYSDGEQYSMNARGPDGRRRPTLQAAGYDKQVNFLNWAAANGYRTVMLDDGPPWWGGVGVTRNPYGLLDFNRDGVESQSPQPGYWYSEAYYYDGITLNDGYLDDAERDEDADGLSNTDETHRRMTAIFWTSCYSAEKPFHLGYEGTDVIDPDTDGDGVRDGADDQDHDDIPNVMELSRNAASGLDDSIGECDPQEGLPQPPDTHHPSAFGRMNPLNPCLPATWSRTCPRVVNSETGAPFDNSPNWYSLN